MTNRIRRTDAEFTNISTEINVTAVNYLFSKNVLLSNAVKSAANAPGVYVLWLNGVAQKCGRVVYSQGLKWRFTQYYNLNYDKKAQKGDYWAVSPQNRDVVEVSWQTCPVNKSIELESKLFDKYGKGPWAKRRPHNNNDTWQLLI